MPFNRESYKQIATQGFFSEYLPPCFFLDKKVLNYVPPENCDIIQPYCFTMSKYDQADSRRNIYIPELGSYLVLHEYMWNNNLLKELIEIRVLSLAACKMIRLFHLQMLHCQKH